MQGPTGVDAVPTRFYDGGEPGESPPYPRKELRIELKRRIGTNEHEVFRLSRCIAYDDRHCGEIVVPPAYDAFESDLVSVPALFTWLVPRTGNHLPAALIHDGLVGLGTDGLPTYTSTAGKVIDRVEADRVFRDGMADTGTGIIRRWLVWTAVTMATLWSREGTSSSPALRRYYQFVVAVTLLVIGALGYLATADLFDVTHRWWLGVELQWMGDRPFATELVSGVAGAIVIPLLLGVLWGRFRRAGWIGGVGVAVLFHVTVALLAVTALYNALEWLAARLPAWVAVSAVGLIVAAAALVLALSWQ